MSSTLSSRRAGAFAAGIVLAGALAACGSSSGGGAPDGGGGDSGPVCPQPVGCPTPTPPATDLTTPTVSFKTDVVPLMQMSCSLSSTCHSTKPPGGPSLLYLGGSLTTAPDPSGILAATVNVKSVELPTMNYVTPGEPTQSYLMLKMDGSFCGLTSMCTSNPLPMCGVVMPMAGCALEATNGGPNPRDVVRRWIAQGAMDN
jgi:hypothetical protein